MSSESDVKTTEFTTKLPGFAEYSWKKLHQWIFLFQQTHSEIAQKNERSLHVTDLLQRIKLLQTENSTRIEQELVFIRRDTTAENRDYFRHELQAAIRDIRADYEAVITIFLDDDKFVYFQISLRNRQDIEVWYREQIRKIQIDSGRVNVDLYKEEIISIRSTLTGVKTRLAELESRVKS